MPVGNYSYQFFICCPRDCVSRHNGDTSGAPLKPLRDDSALRTLSSLGGTRGSPIMPRDAVSRTANVGTVGKNGLSSTGISCLNRLRPDLARESTQLE